MRCYCYRSLLIDEKRVKIPQNMNSKDYYHNHNTLIITKVKDKKRKFITIIPK